MIVDSTAVVSKNAKLGSDVQIGPYSVINDGVVIGDGTVIDSHVVIYQGTEIGRNNRIFAGSVLGGEAQDKSSSNVESFLKIGDSNIIREHTTIHRGSHEGEFTVVGNNNFLMVGSHVAHNCIVHDNVVLTNNTLLAGHVEVNDFVMLGGMVGVHQFCRIGKYAMVGGFSRITEDIVPYALCQGTPRSSISGVNVIGLKRAGFSKDVIVAIRKVYQELFYSKRLFKESTAFVKESYNSVPEIKHLIDFIENSSKRGLCTRVSREQDD